jgi:adenylate kinase
MKLVLEFISREARSNMPISPRIVLLGPHGSGRRTQAQALAKKYDIVNVSMSNLIKESVALESTLGMAIAPHLNKKKKIPDSLLIPLIKERLSKLDCVTRGWVLHGFPKTHDQAESLDQNGFSPNRFI